MISRLLKYPKNRSTVLPFSLLLRKKSAKFSTAAQVRQEPLQKTFFLREKSGVNAEQNHQQLPVEIFHLIRKISIEKEPSYSMLLEQRSDKNIPGILKAEAGLKFILQNDPDLNHSFEYLDNDTRDEMIKNGEVLVVDIPANHGARFLFLIELRSRILSCKRSLALFNRNYYYMNKSKEYEFLLLLVHLMMLRCLNNTAKRGDVILPSQDLGKEVVARSLEQTRIFLASCPFLFSKRDEIQQSLKSSSFFYSPSNLLKNSCFIKGMILEYLALVRIDMFGVSDTADWIMNEAHKLQFKMNYSSFDFSLQKYYLNAREEIDGYPGVALLLSHNLCDQIMMMLSIDRDYEKAAKFLECAKGVYNLEINGHEQKFLFNKRLYQSQTNPQKIMEAFNILQKPKLVHYEIVVRELINSIKYSTDCKNEATASNMKSNGFDTTNESKNHSKADVLIQNQNNQKYVLEQISNVLSRLHKHQEGVSPKILYTIMNFFKSQKQYKTVVNIYETWTNIWSLSTQKTSQSFDIKGQTVALESYFALQDLTKAMNLFSAIERSNQIDGHVLYIMMKNLIKCEFSELALQIYEKYTKSVSSSSSKRKVPQQVYALLMSTLASKADLGGASAVWTNMVNSGYKPTSKHFAIFIRGYGSTMGDMAKAKDVFASAFRFGLEPDSYMYNSLIQGYVRNNRLKDALEVYHEMKAKGVQPDVATECNLIKIYSLKGWEKEMLSALERYKQLSNNHSVSSTLNVTPGQISGYAINPIIKFYAKRDQYSKVFEYLSLLEINPNRDEGYLKELGDSLFPDIKNLSIDDNSLGNEDYDPKLELQKVNTDESLFSSPPSVLLDREIAHDIVLQSLYENKINNSLVDGYIELLMEKECSSSINFPLLFDSYMHHLIRNKSYEKLRDFFYNKVLTKCKPATQRLYLTYIKGMYRLGDQAECNRWLKVILDMGFTPSSRYIELAKKVSVMGDRISDQNDDESEYMRARIHARAIEKAQRKYELRKKAEAVKKRALEKFITRVENGRGFKNENDRQARISAYLKRIGIELQNRAKRRGGPYVQNFIHRRKVIFKRLTSILSHKNRLK